jgi:serine/threonine protein kinase
VYLALHPIMGRKAAIKVLKPELARDESLVTRFFNEARAANAIRHPNIIDIIDVGLLPDDNVPYMLMEFLEGESLATRLERSRILEVGTAVEIASQTASALAAAHSKGIVHRDLKPDNLFLVPDEMVTNGERVKVLDFGIAKLRDDMRGSSMKTRTGAIMGTASYMSPEQCQGLIEKLDHRTDVYALGIILYEMLCGGPPFISEGFGDIIIMHVMKEPEPPQNKNPAVPDAVSEAILRALAKNPDDRFQSMIDFQTALRGIGLPRATPMHGVPSVGTTSILDGPAAAQATYSRRPISAFDRTMATPAPVPVSPGTFPPHVPTVVEQPTPSKQSTTTFRTATGEVADTTLTSTSKRRTIIATASIVGFAAVGLAVTLLVTRPSHQPAVPAKSAATAPEPEPEPAALPEAPVAQPERIPAIEPPTPPPAVAPATLPAEDKHHRKGIANKPKSAPGEKMSAPPAEHNDQPPATAGEKKNTERW